MAGWTASSTSFVFPAPTPRGAIGGRVVDERTGEPLAGVLLEVTGRQTASDEDGEFQLESVPAGMRLVTASRSGYQPARVIVEVEPGGALNRDFPLQPVTTPSIEIAEHLDAVVGHPLTIVAEVEDDGPLSRFEWDLDGDGTFDELTTQPQIVLVPNEAVIFNVILEAVDTDGLRATAGATLFVSARAPEFRRGDATNDGTVDLTDAIATFGFLFLGGRAPQCLDAADADDDGALIISDGIYSLSFLFRGGPVPPAPGPFDCGSDPSEDALGCSASVCEGAAN